MSTFITSKLSERGIATVKLEVGTFKVSASIMMLLARSGLTTDTAQPFSASVKAYNEKNELIAELGVAEGVYHKETRMLTIDEDYHDCKQILFLTMLFTEKEYESRGVATNVLELLPKVINNEFGAKIDAFVLSPIPHCKNSEGQIKQLQLGTEFDDQLSKLLKFYSKRGFVGLTSTFAMGKKLNS